MREIGTEASRLSMVDEVPSFTQIHSANDVPKLKIRLLPTPPKDAYMHLISFYRIRFHRKKSIYNPVSCRHYCDRNKSVLRQRIFFKNFHCIYAKRTRNICFLIFDEKRQKKSKENIWSKVLISFHLITELQGMENYRRKWYQ